MWPCSRIAAFLSVKKDATHLIMGSGMFYSQRRAVSLFSIKVSNAPLISKASAVSTSSSCHAFSTSCVNVAAASTTKRLATAPKCIGLINLVFIAISLSLHAMTFSKAFPKHDSNAIS